MNFSIMSKFKKNKKYKALAMIFTPNGIINEGMILTGEEWDKILVFEVGNSFKQMFELVEDESK